MSRSTRRRGFSQRRSAPAASSSSAWRPCPAPARGPTGRWSTSASACAGSVETRSTFVPPRAASRAAAAASVVLPTPPLPAKKRNCGPPAARLALPFVVLVTGERGFDAGDLVVAAGDGVALAPRPLADLAQAGQQVLLQVRELRLVDLAQLQPHLRVEKLLAHEALVVHLAVDGLGHLVEHEADAADEQRVEQDHWPSRARSSLRRMLTKL